MSYIGNSPGVASQRVTTTLTATAAQTQFTTQSGYVLGYVDVYLNGAKLVNGSDFEAITGTYITLFAGAASGDVVELISYVPRGLSDGYTKAEADSKFLDVGGDTATGNLAFATATLSGNLTLNGGTANGVGYLNGSKVVVAGSALTFDGTVLATPTLNLTNALGIAYGGTGQTTANAALNALLPAQTGNATKYLQTDGTNTTWDAISISTADITGTLPVANGGTGATTAAGALTSLGAYAASNPSGYTTNVGTVTSVGGTGTVSGLTLTGTVSTTGNLTLGGTLDLSAYSAAGAFSTLSASGNTTIGNGVGNGLLFINGQAASSRAILGQTAGTNRWIMYLGNPTAETGSDAGSNFQLFAVSDAGAGIDTPILITRASGGSIALGGTSNRPVTSTGNLGIGTTNINARLVVEGAQVNLDPNIYITQVIRSNAAYNASPRSGISFAVKYHSNNNYVYGATIQGYKNNATEGDYGVGLLFTTQPNGSTPTQSMTLGSDGVLLVGANSNTNSSKLVVAGTISQTVNSTQYLVVDQSDVGTAPNQIPLNQYLGSMAFQDRENVNFTGGTGALSSLDIAAISAQLNVSATSVFIYDTSKDSDGGAWRKRCQHTSWYNEQLNTATRGSRREFPAVAVIVITTTALTIYDGDSPDLPMWMVFNTANYTSFTSTTLTGLAAFVYPIALTSVSALNGTIVTTAQNYQVFLSNFIADTNVLQIAAFGDYTGGYGLYSLPILGRNSAGVYIQYSTQKMLASVVNNVTMTVLPNAPVDPATGLPVPTIAVGTNIGASVLHNNGTVANITCNNVNYTVCNDIEFLPGGAIGLSLEAGDGTYEDSFYVFNSVPYTSTVITVDSKSGSPISADALYSGQSNNANVDVWTNAYSEKSRRHTKQTQFDFGTIFGLSRIAEERLNPSAGLVAYINTAYNTGWMTAKTTLALLSSNTAETLTGAELITNGSFASASNWSVTGGFAIASGVATRTGAAASNLSQTVSIIPGKTYIVSFTVSGLTGTTNLQPTFDGADSAGQVTDNGTFFVQMTATATRTTLLFYVSGTGNITIDNVSMRLADPDRSQGRANIYYDGTGRPIGVYGTVTKTPVAVGADLVAYSGFNGSTNYLEQPYNSALDFGTGNFSFMCWLDLSNISGSQCVFIRSNTSNSNQALGLYLENGTWAIFVGNGSNTSIPIKSGLNFITVKRSNGIVSFYVDGVLRTGVFPAANNINFTDSAAVLKVGSYYIPSVLSMHPDNKVSLLRISNTAPSDAQILKMYNDEKYLFQPNAKATLYGTSNTVTALAYDTDTQLLHAGTSSGRSVFDGLRRVDNTTTAVATAISAVDGLVVEN